MKARLLATSLLIIMVTATHADYTDIHFDMSLTNGCINGNIPVHSQLPAFTVAGVDGNALRFDGYSNYIEAPIDASALNTEALTVSITLAAETYPMMQVDVAETTPTYATLCGNLADEGKKGFALQLSSQGDLKAVVGLNYGNGYRREILGSKKLPRGRWCTVTLAFDKAGNSATLFLNAENIGSSKVNNCDMLPGANTLYIGKDDTAVKSGPFLINTFCGLIDNIHISNAVIDFTLVDPIDYSQFPRPDFSYPAERYAASLWRPQFHAMPSGSWTNETHGMTYSDGRYHVFFQKNANGPYMSRLHWGHISSENLYDWRDEPIAVAPGESYDIKGCWSGCVYDDNGTPTILYTAVDNAKARIAKATPTDATLADWQKQGVIIDGRPSGLSDDFRDPYYFEANGNKYIIVGTSKNGLGACTLHKYNNGSWTNDGTIFFQATNVNQHGTFWEMPNVTPLTPPEGGKPGKYLFTCTPLGTGVGVRTLCWVGTIGTDGKFTPSGDLQYLEMAGISRDGYGLLSPTIYQHGEKTLMLGIVPDKLPTQTNFEMGWAHNYSLPRELSLDASGKLVQKPYSGLAAMRTTETVSVNKPLLGAEPLVSGRQIELLGEFTPTTGTCGFRFLRDASLTYDAATRSLTLDVSNLQRTVNDGGVYNGVYSATVPEALKKLHVFLDGSILDIFVNDRWAFSVRVFPTDATATTTEVFSTGETAVNVQAWTLDAKQTTGMSEKVIVKSEKLATAIYDLQGRSLSAVHQHGVYIQNGRKYVAR